MSRRNRPRARPRIELGNACRLRISAAFRRSPSIKIHKNVYFCDTEPVERVRELDARVRVRRRVYPSDVFVSCRSTRPVTRADMHRCGGPRLGGLAKRVSTVELGNTPQPPGPPQPWRAVTVLTRVNPYRASKPFSRPCPDWPTPPKGSSMPPPAP